VKINPAHKGSIQAPPPGEALRDPAFCRLVVGLLLMRLGGGPQTFTQEDLDRMVGLFVMEGRNAEGGLMFGLGSPRTPKEKQQ
jgi:hypothetical protein